MTSTKNALVVFDMDEVRRVDTHNLAIPMNLNKLLESSIMEIDGFLLERFRANGMHIEETAEGNHILYVSHNYFHEDEACISTNVSRIELEPGNTGITQSGDWETIFTAEPCMYPEADQHMYVPFAGEMSGGPIVEYDEDHLLVSVGSFHRDGLKYESLTMDTSSAFGKIVLLNKNTGEYSFYAMGLRNPQGLHIDEEGRIWATDHGPQGGDELNLIERGNNYGWPEVTYGTDYGNRPWPHAEEQGRHDSYDQPVYTWVSTIAPTNLISIKEGERFPLWKGDLLIGSLNGLRRGQSLYRLRIQGDNRIIYREQISFERRIRDITALPDGRIALIADEGLLILIEDGGPVYEDAGPVVEERTLQLEKFSQLQGERFDDTTLERGGRAENIFMQKCSSCHYLQEINGVGPHLNDIFNRQVGELDDFNYSSSLSDKNEPWTPELMKSFLLEPDNEFPNTTMQQVSLTEAETDSIIQFLNNYD